MRLASMLALTGGLLALAMPAEAETRGESAPNALRLSLALDSDVYQVGQPIVYVVSLVNTSNAVVDDVHEIDTSANFFSLMVEKDGKPLSRVGLFKDIMYIGPGMSLEPGGCVVAVDNVLSRYGERRDGKMDPRRAEGFILQPGRYCIRAYFQSSSGTLMGGGHRGLRSEETCITISEEGPREFSAEYADSILAAVTHEVVEEGSGWGPACAAALAKNTNTAAYWFLLECAQGRLDSSALIKLLNSVSESGGGPVRRAAILDWALRGRAVDSALEIEGIAARLVGPTRALERRVAASWWARYSQGRFPPARRIR